MEPEEDLPLDPEDDPRADRDEVLAAAPDDPPLVAPVVALLAEVAPDSVEAPSEEVVEDTDPELPAIEAEVDEEDIDVPEKPVAELLSPEVARELDVLAIEEAAAVVLEPDVDVPAAIEPSPEPDDDVVRAA